MVAGGSGEGRARDAMFASSKHLINQLIDSQGPEEHRSQLLMLRYSLEHYSGYNTALRGARK